MRVGVSLLVGLSATISLLVGSALADDAPGAPPTTPTAPAQAETSDDASATHAQVAASEGAPASASGGVKAEQSVESGQSLDAEAAADVTSVTSSESARELAESVGKATPDEVEGQELPSLTETADSYSRVQLAAGLASGPAGDGESTLTVRVGVNGQNAEANTAVPTHPYSVFRFLGWPIGPHGDESVAPPTPDDGGQENQRTQAVGATGTAAPSLTALAAGTLIAGATAGAAGLLLVPGWRTALVRFLKGAAGFGLFTRLTGDDVLGHPRRNEIVEYVRHNPGERLEIARRALNIPNGVMLHHVRMLVQGDVLRVHRIDGMTRLYLAGPRVQPTPYVPPLRRRLLAELQRTPGATQRQIAHAFGLSERVVSYHVGWLAQRGLLSVQRDGPAKRCYPVAPAVTA